MLNIVIPLGGKGERFRNQHIVTPKPLVQLQGFPFFYWSAKSITTFYPAATLTFVVLEDHCKTHQIDTQILTYFPKATIVRLPHVLDGPVHTCLAGVQHIQNDCPVVFNDCDHILYSQKLTQLLHNTNYQLSSDNTVAGLLLTFFADGPQHSYCKVNANGEVVETAEKQVISNHAICGAYLFKDSALFKKYAALYLKESRTTEYFMSGLYNTLIKHNENVRHLSIDFDISFGTPSDFENAKDHPLFAMLK